MKKVMTILLLSFFCSDFYAQSDKSVQTLKLNDFANGEINSVLRIVFPARDFNNWYTESFTITCDGTDLNSGQDFYYQEITSCGHLTEKMKQFMNDNAGLNYRFSLSNIKINNNGEPGTPYNPALVKEDVLPDFEFKLIK